MDQELKRLMTTGDEGVTRTLRMNDAEPDKGEIKIDVEGGEPISYTLRPLDELYGRGTGVEPVDPKDQRFMPLFNAIEEAIQVAYRDDRGLTDGAVGLALAELSMNPAAPTTNPLAQRVRQQLRLVLSVNDYSRDEVKAAIRKVHKSVERHTRSEGPRGYLDFVRRMLRF